MKTYYTISEIGKILGLTSDTIRFYEKKGLVHPSINPNNKYRMYTMMNVLELLDVIYYRHLGVPVSDIYSLSLTSQPSDIMELIDKKEEETKRRIYYETQLLKKIEHIKSTFHKIESNENVCSIQYFNESMILCEGKEHIDFFAHDIQYMSQDQFVLGAFYVHYTVDSNGLNQQRTFVLMETSVVQEMNMSIEKDASFIPLQKCIYLAVKMNQGKISFEDVKPMLEFAKKEKYEITGDCLVREIPITFYKDFDHYYAEIFLPIKS